MIEQIKAHAIEHYNENGWDFLVECWSDQDISACIKNCSSLEQAIAACAKQLTVINEYRQEIWNMTHEH